MYRLKQSPRVWFGNFNKVIQQFGMIRCAIDHSIFFKCPPLNEMIDLVVHVDDIVITGDDEEGIEQLN